MEANRFTEKGSRKSKQPKWTLTKLIIYDANALSSFTAVNAGNSFVAVNARNHLCLLMHIN